MCSLISESFCLSVVPNLFARLSVKAQYLRISGFCIVCCVSRHTSSTIASMEEEDGVNWEDEDAHSEDDSEVGGEAAVEELINITIHTGKGKATLTTTGKSDKKPTFKRVNFSDEDYQQCLLCHQTDLEAQISASRTAAFATSSSRLQSVLLAELPADIAATLQYPAGLTQLIELVKWVNRTHRLIPHDSLTVEEGRDGSNEWDLEHCVLKHKAGSSNQICQVLAALLIAVGYTIRTVRTIDPVSFAPQDHAEVYEKSWRAANPEAPSSSFKPRKTVSAPIVHTWLEVRIDTGTHRIHNDSVKYQCGSGSKSKQTKFSDTASSSQGVIDLTDSGDECATIIPPAPASSSGNSGLHNTKQSGGGAGAESRWVAVDAVHKCIDQPQFIEEVLRKNKPLQYVLAFECVPTNRRYGDNNNNTSTNSRGASSSACGGSMVTPVHGKVVDVTSTYKLRHHYSTNRDKQTKAEVDAWLVSLLDAINEGTEVPVYFDADTQAPALWSPVTGGGNSRDHSQVVDLTDDVWDVDADRSSEPSSSSAKKARVHAETTDAVSSDLSVKYPLPERINDFKDHPVYLLSRHLLSEQALHPSAYAVGVFRGESVYLQVHKETLRSRLQWRRLLKQVRRDEEPIKMIQRRLRSLEADGTGEGYAHAGDGGEGGANKMVEIRLFGSWQTEPIQVIFFGVVLMLCTSGPPHR